MKYHFNGLYQNETESDKTMDCDTCSGFLGLLKKFRDFIWTCFSVLGPQPRFWDHKKVTKKLVMQWFYFKISLTRYLG